MNKVYILAEQEEHRFNVFSIGPLEVNYLDKRTPLMAVLWSLFIPGLGQFYIHRLVTAFIGIFSTTSIFYFSNFLEAFTLLMLGDIQQATSVLEPEWLLFLPSMYGFSMYNAYVNTVENNKLFDREQCRFLQNNYQNPSFRILKR